MATNHGWDDQLTQLNALLAELYSDTDAAQFVLAKAGLSPGLIKVSAAPLLNWFNILHEARKRSLVDAIVKVARADYPNRPEWDAIFSAAEPAAPPAKVASILSGEQLQTLRDALLSAYPSESALAQMVFFEMNLSLDEITNGNLSERVFQLIKWSVGNGRVDDLVSAAHRRNPGNPAMAGFFQRWLVP